MFVDIEPSTGIVTRYEDNKECTRNIDMVVKNSFGIPFICKYKIFNKKDIKKD